MCPYHGSLKASVASPDPAPAAIPAVRLAAMHDIPHGLVLLASAKEWHRYWWLPDTPETGFQAVLLSSRTVSRIELIGGLDLVIRNPTSVIHEVYRRVPVISDRRRGSRSRSWIASP